VPVKFAYSQRRRFATFVLALRLLRLYGTAEAIIQASGGRGGRRLAGRQDVPLSRVCWRLCKTAPSRRARRCACRCRAAMRLPRVSAAVWCRHSALPPPLFLRAALQIFAATAGRLILLPRPTRALRATALPALRSFRIRCKTPVPCCNLLRDGWFRGVCCSSVSLLPFPGHYPSHCANGDVCRALAVLVRCHRGRAARWMPFDGILSALHFRRRVEQHW